MCRYLLSSVRCISIRRMAYSIDPMLLNELQWVRCFDARGAPFGLCWDTFLDEVLHDGLLGSLQVL